MNTNRGPIRERFPLTWTFHRNTSRWTFNTLEAGSEGVPTPGKEHPDAPFVPLPQIDLPAVSLAQAINDRFSCRQYLPTPARLADLAVVVRGAYGIKRRGTTADLELLERPVPSGGGMYPLEVYLLVTHVLELAPGVYHYAPVADGLERLREVALPAPFMTYLFMGQHFVAEAAFVVVFTAVLTRSMRKYGDRGYRYVLFEAGHAAQNVNLVAAAAGLGSCNLGGFFDNELGALLALDLEQEVPLYAVVAGVPGPADRSTLRTMRSE